MLDELSNNSLIEAQICLPYGQLFDHPSLCSWRYLSHNSGLLFR